ncbi:hypothetical protein GMOD_00003995 [Pyrenophora seminiperda CCB06]|uniref:Uncharacterized protein n=1 Tax=Pyrenophora seminiperda CCB06 TaxID=1302712 RepID=A0A3M7M0E0_9PLEO|nr:hypothetical protein GMOD_00003995 [Pyrenophora seminiperda CCB06]
MTNSQYTRANCACSTTSEETVERTPNLAGHRSTTTPARDPHEVNTDLLGVGEQFDKDTGGLARTTMD